MTVINHPYRTRNRAALAAEAVAIPRTKDYNQGKADFEFGGWILMRDGTYFYTDPMRGCERGKTDIGNMIVPKGYTKVARYHTHPDSGSWGEGFSIGDVNNATGLRMVSYVGMTYSGNVRIYIPGVTRIPENAEGGAIIGDLIGNINRK